MFIAAKRMADGRRRLYLGHYPQYPVCNSRRNNSLSVFYYQKRKPHFSLYMATCNAFVPVLYSRCGGGEFRVLTRNVDATQNGLLYGAYMGIFEIRR